MMIVYCLLMLLSIVISRSLWPVKGLDFIDSDMLDQAISEKEIKILDVRDAVLYEENHLPGSVNISIGRLPFLWDKELNPFEPILILSDSHWKTRRAARILKRNGFGQLYAQREISCP